MAENKIQVQQRIYSAPDVFISRILGTHPSNLTGEPEARKKAVCCALSGLVLPEDKELLKERFGLCGNPPITRTESAKRLKVSDDALRQRETKALGAIRNPARHPFRYQGEPVDFNQFISEKASE